LGGIDWWQFGQAFWRTLIATIPLILACLWIANLSLWQREDEWILKSVMLGIGIGLSVIGYVGTHAIYRSPELNVLWQLVQTKVLRRMS